MTNRIAMIDAALAVVIAAIVLIVSPGIAVTGMIALAVAIVCAVSFGWESARRRRRRRP